MAWPPRVFLRTSAAFGGSNGLQQVGQGVVAFVAGVLVNDVLVVLGQREGDRPWPGPCLWVVDAYLVFDCFGVAQPDALDEP